MNTQKNGGGGVSVARWVFDKATAVVYFLVSTAADLVFRYFCRMIKSILDVFMLSFFTVLFVSYLFAPEATSALVSAGFGVMRSTVTSGEFYMALFTLARRVALQPLLSIAGALLAPEQ